MARKRAGKKFEIAKKDRRARVPAIGGPLDNDHVFQTWVKADDPTYDERIYLKSAGGEYQLKWDASGDPFYEWREVSSKEAAAIELRSRPRCSCTPAPRELLIGFGTSFVSCPNCVKAVA